MNALALPIALALCAGLGACTAQCGVPPAPAAGAASAQSAHAGAPIGPTGTRALVVRGKVFDLDAPLPNIGKAKMRGAYMATRPLIGAGTSGRSLARTFKCYDCKETHDIEGLVTITGGKATTLRLMGEKTADLVCQKLSVSTMCSTQEVPLLSYRQFYTLPN